MSWPDFGIGPGNTRARLAALGSKPLNFDRADAGAPAWHRDDYRQPLPPERPGLPEPGGSWETARRLSRDYAFADPSLVEAHFDPEVPLRRPPISGFVRYCIPPTARAQNQGACNTARFRRSKDSRLRQ